MSYFSYFLVRMDRDRGPAWLSHLPVKPGPAVAYASMQCRENPIHAVSFRQQTHKPRGFGPATTEVGGLWVGTDACRAGKMVHIGADGCLFDNGISGIVIVKLGVGMRPRPRESTP